MHTWLAFLAGILTVIGAFLILAGSIGISYYGLAVQFEIALAFVLLLIAGISAWLFYVGIKAQYKRVKTGKEALIGAKGVVTTTLNPKGEVRVSGEFWEAITKDAAILSGQDVEVVDLEGMFLVVKPAVIEQKA
jgi:membrane-bound serine protease (ClpP class)